MKAEDTVMGKTQRDNIFYRGVGTLEGVCNMQAEISYKAGIKEVVEWIEKEFGYFIDDRLAKIIVDDGGYYGNKGSIKKYQAQLKEWGIKEGQ